ncbi:MAG: PucR family transcriptional regulator [Synergistaceae bacterium]|nr:PucR family transcriptional regulator [Synergistaceae bacterium]
MSRDKMGVTVQDITNIDRLRTLKLVAGAGGLDRAVAKVGILDFEFTKAGMAHCTDNHWRPNEFILSTFLYAKDDPSFLTDAVKKLFLCKSSGIAIKNVFSLEIEKEAIRYANKNNFPIFVFTDESLFFEDAIILVNELIKSAHDADGAERIIASILHNDCDKMNIQRMALEINPSLCNTFIAFYIALNDQSDINRLPVLLSRWASRSSALIRHMSGLFYVYSAPGGNLADSRKILSDLCVDTGLQGKNICVGESNVQYFLYNFKKALLQCWYAAVHASITGRSRSRYDELGVYKLLFPKAETEWADDFYNSIITPIIEHDIQNGTDLLGAAMVYEECRGSVRDAAHVLSTHENTVRYRIAGIRKILSIKPDDPSFEEQLSLAVKLRRIKTKMHDDA